MEVKIKNCISKRGRKTRGREKGCGKGGKMRDRKEAHENEGRGIHKEEWGWFG